MSDCESRWRHKKWTETTRSKYEREGLRYASDLTGAEWDVIGPLLPPPKRLGRPRTTAMHEVVNAILYMAHVLPVADVAEGLSTEEHGSGLFLRLAHRRNATPASCWSRALRISTDIAVVQILDRIRV